MLFSIIRFFFVLIAAFFTGYALAIFFVTGIIAGLYTLLNGLFG